MDKKMKVSDFIRQVGPVRLALLVICGVFLLFVSLPDTAEEKNLQTSSIKTEKNRDQNDLFVEKMEKRLEEILTSIEGVGKVRVMITLASSSEKILHQDETLEDSKETENGEDSRVIQSSSSKKETVLVEEEGEEQPYVVKTVEPVVEGVVVVMEGGNNQTLNSRVTEAVEALFHVESHKIRVLKMEVGS